MNSLLYILAVLLLIGWALGVFIYAASGIIHLLLVMSIISLVMGIVRRPTAI